MSRYEVSDILDRKRLELGAAAEARGSGHWRYAMDERKVGWLVLDCRDKRVNTVSQPVLEELAEQLEQIEEDLPEALVIRSAKPAGFAAGADIGMLSQMASDDIETLLREAHGVLDRLEGLSCPTIAIVHGAALGAGCEIALACDWRVAIEGASFGLPEVRLGLHPGLGGTVRLPRLIDPLEAMTLMLTGSTAHTKKAKRLGIADLVTEERHVQPAVAAILRGDVKRKAGGLKQRAFEMAPARNLAAGRMRRETQAKAPQEHYPAPHALIDLWAEHGGDAEAMQKAEIASFARLLQSTTCRNLIRVFFLRQTLKDSARNGNGDERGHDDGIAVVHVIGAGVMGAEIAGWAAMQGKRVTLSDPDPKALGRAVRTAQAICEDGHLNSLETRDALDRLMPDPHGYGTARADLVIEAGPEKPEIKQKIFADLAATMKTGAILATNTSSLELERFVDHAPAKARFAGLHFFNPVRKVPLVEVVSHARTDKQTRERLLAFCADIGRLPVALKDSPGFLVNRALMPYLLEALLLMEEGIDKEVIDTAATRFGMPMGPVVLADQVGLDICLDVASSMQEALSETIADIPARLREKVEAGETGRKAGRGFYDWSDGTPKPDSDKAPPEDIEDRLFLPMLDACASCLRRGIVGSQDEVDAAMIFATGFAPFRGGPMHYARTRGHPEIAAALELLQGRHGERFTPDPYWSEGH
jgi:3-hydroxyacyl-CoA dehydrogenase/enoyl-CoA hydratase/3-hydroxybutyryl-CoA epimerase